MIPALGSEHAGPGESESCLISLDECQVACRDKHTCIDKSNSESMY